MATKGLIPVRIQRYFDVPPERVFDAFLDVESARRFLYASRGGEIVEAKIEPYVGGHFLMADLRNGIRVEHHGSFVEIDRPRRLVYTFFVPGYSRVFEMVTLEFARDSSGGCELTLTHMLEPDYAPFVDITVAAYREHLSRLTEVLGG